MVGIIQEQHPDRARLFMHWKEMGWPILVDSLNLLDTTVVPQTLAIDEHGTIQLINPDRDHIEEEFLSQTYEAPATSEARQPREPVLELPGLRASAGEWRAYADQEFRWGRSEDLTAVIAAYDRALELVPGDGPIHFRLGVAHRARYDSGGRQPDDFREAVEHWEAAPAGKLQMHILGAISEFERARCAERVRAGLARVRREGRRLGRPPVHVSREAVDSVRGLPVREAARRLGVSRSTAHRVLGQRPALPRASPKP